jgi:CheY-like chemotaxis protein
MADQKKKIIIIDDEKSFANILATTLKKLGFEVKFYLDSCEALKNVIKDKPDIILLDIMMPGLNGIEVFKHLKQDLRGQKIKIFFLTNLEETESGIKIDDNFALSVGADGYIKKADGLEKMLEKIKGCL